MVVIRLARSGKKGAPVYRIVVQDKASKLTGKFIEKIGSYKPGKDKNALFQLNSERLAYWTQKGGQPSERLQSLIATHTVGEAGTPARNS